jgi:hypothetical protein
MLSEFTEKRISNLVTKKNLWALVSVLLGFFLTALITALSTIKADGREYTDKIMLAHNLYHDRLLSEVCGMRNDIVEMKKDIAIIKYFNVPEDRQ